MTLSAEKGSRAPRFSPVKVFGIQLEWMPIRNITRAARIAADTQKRVVDCAARRFRDLRTVRLINVFHSHIMLHAFLHINDVELQSTGFFAARMLVIK